MLSLWKAINGLKVKAQYNNNWREKPLSRVTLLVSIERAILCRPQREKEPTVSAAVI